MDSLPLVSVIIPCYNAEEFVEEAISSITGQTYRNLEIICINDGSKDRTGSILEQLATKDTRIKVIHNESNLKLIGTLNKAVDLAQGELIARMDADDISLPKRIEEQVTIFLRKPEVDVVSMAVYVINSKNKNLGRITDFNCTSHLACTFVALLNPPVSHPAVMVRAAVLKDYKYGNAPSMIHVEDYDLWSRLILAGKKFHNIQEPHLLYRLNTKGVSISNRKSQGDHHLLISQKMLGEILHVKTSDEVLRVIARYSIPANAKTLYESLKEFRCIKDSFIKRYKTDLTSRDYREIENWYLQRVLFINFISMQKGTLAVKLSALLLTCFYPKALIYKETYTNILLRLNILLYR